MSAHVRPHVRPSLMSHILNINIPVPNIPSWEEARLRWRSIVQAATGQSGRDSANE